MITILLGIVSSVAAELVTALNKKLTGTVLQGDASFLVAFGMAFVGALIHAVATPGFTLSALLNIQTLTSSFSEIFAVSQVYFLLVVQKLNLDVQPSATPAPKPAQTATSSVTAGI